MIFCLFSILNWIRDHYNTGLPIHSQVCFSRMFTSDPKSKITWSISYSPICVISLISRLILLLCLTFFHTTCGSLGVFLAHLFISSYNPFTTLLSRGSFMQVSRKVVSIEGSISWSSLSFLRELEALEKLFFSSMNVSRVCSKLNLASFTRALLSHVLYLGCFPLSSPVAIPLWSTMFARPRPHHLQVLSRLRW